MLLHDIASQTITEPPQCFTVGTRHSGLQASLGVLQVETLNAVEKSMKDNSSEHYFQ
jgi:hypothetical protein